MNRISSISLAVVLAFVALFATLAPAQAATPRVAVFRQNSALYVQGGTTGPFNKLVNGKLSIADPVVAGGNLTVTGALRGLAPNTRYSVVAYKDGACLPTPGLTAFPSSAITSNATGYAKVAATINPKSLNPLGTLTAAQIKSVSVRLVVINGVALPFTVPNNPYPATPTVPNVAYVEACDTTID